MSKRSDLLRRSSALRARLVQRAAATAIVSWLSPRLVHLNGLPPRRVATVDDRLMRLARPLHFPQRGSGHSTLQFLEPVDAIGFTRTRNRIRRRNVVRIVPSCAVTKSDATSMLVLAASGAPLFVSDAAESVVNELGDEVTQLFEQPPPADPTDRERRSVRLRRAARHRLVRGEAIPEATVLLATKRPELLTFALGQIAGQRDCRLRLVVGLHGDGWSHDHELELPRDAQVVRFDSSVALGSILRRLTALSSTPIVTKWDDDDWYGSHHVRDLIDAYVYSGADIVGKAAEFVRLEGSDVTIRRFGLGAESYGWTLAGGTLLTSVAWIQSVGGWPAVERSVDQALLAAGRENGGSAYRTHGFEYVLRRRTTGGHTWAAPDEHFLRAACEVRPGLDLAFADVTSAAGDGPPYSSAS